MALSASSSSILEYIQNPFSFQGYLGVLHHLHLPLLTLCHRQDGPGGDTLSANFFTKLTISEPNWDDS